MASLPTSMFAQYDANNWISTSDGRVNQDANWSLSSPLSSSTNEHLFVNDPNPDLQKSINMNRNGIQVGGFSLGSDYTWAYQPSASGDRIFTVHDIFENEGFMDLNRTANDDTHGFNYNGTSMNNTGTIRMRVATAGGGAEMNLSDTNTNHGAIELVTVSGGGSQTSLNITGAVTLTNQGTVTATNQSSASTATITGVAGSTYTQAGGSTIMGTDTRFEVPTLQITGGTFDLSGDSSYTDRIADTVNITMGGGVFNTNGLSERGATSAGVGTLTLQNTATIDMGSGSSILWFAAYDHQGGTLDIANWDGVVGQFGGTDQLRFTQELTQAQLGSIMFNGQLAAQQSFFSDDGGYWEVAAIPEPTTGLLFATGLAGLLMVLRRRPSHH